MKLEFVKSVDDSRGKILFYKYDGLSFNLVETKKRFSRTGHSHKFPSTHFLLKGKITFKTMDHNLNREQIEKFSVSCKIVVQAM